VLFTAPPSLSCVALWLLLSVLTGRPAQQKYAIAGAACMLRLWSGCSHVGCLHHAVGLLWRESRGKTCGGGFVPTEALQHRGSRGCWYHAPHGFYCHRSVAAVTSGCLPCSGMPPKGGQVLATTFAAFPRGDGALALPRFRRSWCFHSAVNATSPFVATVTSNTANQ